MTDALHSHAARRTRFALIHFDDHMRRVVMRFSIINVPCAGADMRYHLQVLLAGSRDVVVEDIHADAYIAADCATVLAGRTVARNIDHHQSLLKKDHAFESELQRAEAAPAHRLPHPDSDGSGEVTNLITDKYQNPNLS